MQVRLSGDSSQSRLQGRRPEDRLSMRGTIKIGSVYGIPIGLSPSWFLTLAFVLLILGLRVYPFAPALRDESPTLQWALACVSSLLFFLSIITHELAHAFVARAFGIQVKGIRLFAFGGVAQIATDPTTPRQELVMALAGPLTSLVLGVVFLLLAFLAGGSDEPLGVLWLWLGIMNLGLGVFNLLPGFPMDGGRVLRALFWVMTKDYFRATRWSARGGQAAAYLLLALALLSVLERGTLPVQIDRVSSLWLLFLALFLNNAARQSWSQVRIIEILRGFRVADVMRTELATVDRSMTLQEIAALREQSQSPLCFFVVDGEERVIGLVTDRELRAVRKARWPTVTAGEAMRPAEQIPVAPPNEDAATALQRMEFEDLTQMPVVDDGRLLGVVGREAFMRLLVRERSSLRS